ncbi:uncharacterized protein LOC129606043 [Condylostylus longicornis]|uniref:uncharacterized protein LOC129606043 n=1 Tax=Condylostylus longicornis TaxID=2530218 RepID=UPI00244E2B7E|nr:uncharacterized protein LOC129606043 [Condylostylus longicornis]
MGAQIAAFSPHWALQARTICGPFVFYKTLIRPVVTYGLECYSRTAIEENTLRIFERQILRKIFGTIQKDENSWRIRYNDELNVEFAELNIIRLAGHEIQMEQIQTSKKMLTANLESSRSRGRSRKRWLEGVETDLHKMGVRNRKNVAIERDKWRKLVDEATTHTEL